MISAGVTMNSLQRKLDLIANNLANMNTAGFKRQDAGFEDLLTSIKSQRGKSLPGRLTPPVLPLGAGARLTALQLDLTQGSLQETGNPLDLALEGGAWFEIGVPVPDEEGELAYETAWTRNGAFRLAAIQEDPENLMLTTAEGYPVMDEWDIPITVPVTNRDVYVDRQGNVYANMPEEDEPMLLGTLKVVQMNRPQLLEARGDNLVTLPGDLNDPAVREELVQVLDLNAMAPDDAQVAVLAGYLEASNVDLTTEMADLLQVQRAYQLNARALTSSHEMMNIANRLRG